MINISAGKAWELRDDNIIISHFLKNSINTMKMEKDKILVAYSGVSPETGSLKAVS